LADERALLRLAGRAGDAVVAGFLHLGRVRARDLRVVPARLTDASLRALVHPPSRTAGLLAASFGRRRQALVLIPDEISELSLAGEARDAVVALILIL
jgi:hypothetical protein